MTQSWDQTSLSPILKLLAQPEMVLQQLWSNWWASYGISEFSFFIGIHTFLVLKWGSAWVPFAVDSLPVNSFTFKQTFPSQRWKEKSKPSSFCFCLTLDFEYTYCLLINESPQALQMLIGIDESSWQLPLLLVPVILCWIYSRLFILSLLWTLKYNPTFKIYCTQTQKLYSTFILSHSSGFWALQNVEPEARPWLVLPIIAISIPWCCRIIYPEGFQPCPRRVVTTLQWKPHHRGQLHQIVRAMQQMY